MPDQDLIGKLKSDYRNIERYVHGIEDATTIVDIQTKIKKLKETLETHFKAEEMSIYPKCLEKNHHDLEGLVRMGERDHTEIKQKLWSMGSPDIKSTEWKDKVQNLKTKINEYITREEKDLFPLLTKVFDDKQIERIRKEYGSFEGRRVSAA